MAIASMKKIHILAHNSVRESVLSTLQKMGVVQIRDLKDRLDTEYFSGGERVEKAVVEEKLLKITGILDFMEKLSMGKNLSSAIFREKMAVNETTFAETLKNTDLDRIYAQCRDTEEGFRDIEKERANINQNLKQVLPWSGLNSGLAELIDREKTAVRTGTVLSKSLPEFERRLCGKTRYIHLEKVGRDRKHAYLLIIFLKEEEGIVGPLFKEFEFNRCVFPAEDACPRVFAQRLRDRLAENGNARDRLEKAAWAVTVHRRGIRILYDYYNSSRDRLLARECMAETASSSLLSGWIEEEKIDLLTTGLAKKAGETEIIVQSPEKGEKVPVVLKNMPAVQPFEVVTDLYGRPLYSGFDPTPCLTPFFILFFALCLTDAGYGLVLAVASWLIPKKLALGPKAKKFFRLFFYGGIATVFTGALTGGWFGDTIDLIPGLEAAKRIKNSMVVLNPLKYPEKFLYFSLALGVIQVWFGILLKFCRNLKNRELAGAFLDEFPWMFLFVSVALAALSESGILPPVAMEIGKWTAAGCLCTVVLFYGRGSKTVFGRIISGLYRVYGGVDYVKDILSYSRLFALGLGTGIMAMAVNTIARLVLSVPYVGVVMMPVVFLGGHFFNIIINLLSGYIHTSRLQYVEFFTKFFEGGGEFFKPFREERRYTAV